MMIVVVVFCSLFSLFSCQTVWISPRQSQLIPVNSNITVNIKSTSLISVPITQGCGPDYVVSRLIRTNTNVLFGLPYNYLGVCSFVCNSADPTLRLVIVEPVVSFVTPTSPPLIAYPAGDSIEVVLAYAPVQDVDPEFEVGLECISDPGRIIRHNITGGPDGGLFPVPTDIYGEFCVLILLAPGYISSNNPTIAVSQQLEFIQPQNNSISINQFPVNVFLKTGHVPINETVYLIVRNMDTDFSDFFMIPTNTSVFLNLNESFIGVLNFSVYPPSPDLAAPIPVSIFRTDVDVLELSFTEAPSQIFAGDPFTVLVAFTVDLEILVDLLLICESSEIYYEWSGVQAGREQVLIVPSNIKPGGTDCRLQTYTQYDFVSNAVSPVKVQTSPFGGSVSPMNPEEIDLFLKTVTIISLNRNNVING